jgi:hypothetical protein
MRCCEPADARCAGARPDERHSGLKEARSMRWKAPVFAALTIGALAASCTGPGPGVTGNDTGGIIPWSPIHNELAPQFAAEHCARYGKRSRITSVRARYGDYIAFACSWR